MMKTFKISFLLLTFFFFLLMACKKDDGLTKATQTGTNTFSCLIDGKLFVPKKSSLSFSGEPLHNAYNPQNNTLYIGAFNSENNRNIHIYINNIYKGVGVYQMDNQSYIEYNLYNPEKSYYYTKLTGQGNVTITRSDNNIVSGTFEFVAQNQDNANDNVACTKGRFDLVVNGIE